MQDASKRGNGMGGRGGEGIGTVLSTQFFCIPKTTKKNLKSNNF